jgi:hypothetical protein
VRPVIGAHLANGAVTDADLALLHAGGFAGALLRWDHNVEVAHRVRDVAPDAGLVVRLPDSSGTIIPRDAALARESAAIIARRHAVGVTRVQVNNTPCWQPAWGSTRAREWATTLADVLDALRPEIGPGVQLGRTPRATPTTLESWQAAARAKLLPRCDWIAAPSYWQAARDRWNPAFGAANEVYGTWASR